MNDRINWKVAGPASVVGAGAIVAGLLVGEFERAAFSSVLINAGTAIGLVVVLVLLERGVFVHVAAVAREAAAETVERETAELRNRVVRLENLDEAQAQQRDRRRQAATEAVQMLLDQELSAASVGELLTYAYDDRLFGEGRFRVRTSPSPDCHLLYLLPLEAKNRVAAVWLDFEPFDWGDTVEVGGRPIPTPKRRDTTVMWIHDEDAAEIASELEAGLERMNVPTHGFSLEYALRRLARSVEVVRGSRRAEAGDPLRLKGTLELLINDDWAITSFGLESVSFDIAYRASWAQFMGSGGGAVWHPTTLRGVTDPPDEARGGWDEALVWVTDREGWALAHPS
jgi:hypothetical protein